MPHTDAIILARKIGLGPIGSAKINELSPSADNPASDLTETTRVFCLERARVGSPVDPTAPATTNCPPLVAGIFSDFPVHGHDQ
jgi:hypothetical protein